MALIQMMDEKWRIVFKLIDIDKDGKLTNQDKESSINSFISIYNSEDETLTQLKHDLDQFWNCLLFPEGNTDWTLKISEDEFVANMNKSFINDKSKLVATVSDGLKHLFQVVDNNKDGIFTYEKFFKFHSVFNLAVDVLVRATFNLIVDSGDKETRTFDQVLQFYVELFIGEDRDKFENLKNAYRAIGML